jgi:hypothetical protein
MVGRKVQLRGAAAGSSFDCVVIEPETTDRTRPGPVSAIADNVAGPSALIMAAPVRSWVPERRCGAEGGEDEAGLACTRSGRRQSGGAGYGQSGSDGICGVGDAPHAERRVQELGDDGSVGRQVRSAAAGAVQERDDALEQGLDLVRQLRRLEQRAGLTQQVGGRSGSHIGGSGCGTENGRCERGECFHLGQVGHGLTGSGKELSDQSSGIGRCCGQICRCHRHQWLCGCAGRHD